MKQYSTDFLDLALESEALKFGTFTLKSGRQSPYFFNMGLFCSGKLLSTLATSYAKAIIDSGVEFDVIFGPAYKGIPLAALTVAKLAELDPQRYNSVGYAFNRKEKKDHGEGGSLVGSDIANKKVLIIDDIITAGTAINEGFDIIREAKGKVVGCIIALDRQETTAGSDISATKAVLKKHDVPVLSISCFDDILNHLGSKISAEQREAIVVYRNNYLPKEH